MTAQSQAQQLIQQLQSPYFSKPNNSTKTSPTSLSVQVNAGSASVNNQTLIPQRQQHQQQSPQHTVSQNFQKSAV